MKHEHVHVIVDEEQKRQIASQLALRGLTWKEFMEALLAQLAPKLQSGVELWGKIERHVKIAREVAKSK